MLILTLTLACTAPVATTTCEEETQQMEAMFVHGLSASAIADYERPAQRGPGLAVADLDGDGWLDLVVTAPLGEGRFFHNTAGVLAPAALWVDGGALPPAVGVAAADVDLDGDVDLLLTGATGEPDRLLRNRGGMDFTSEDLPGSEGESKTASFADADADGDLDVFIAGFFPDINSDLFIGGQVWGEGNYLYLQVDGDFERADGALPESVVGALTYHGAWLDVEGDGDLDLYITNDHGAEVVPNQLLLNDGAARFSESPGCYCTLSMAGMGVAVGDADGDGWPDLYLTDEGSNTLLRNMADGTFLDVTLASDALPDREEIGASWASQFVDLDLDGWEDLATAYGALIFDEAGSEERSVLLFSEEGAGFVDATEASGLDEESQGRSMVVGDLDRDGRPDLVFGSVADDGQYYVARAWRNGGCRRGVTLRFAGAHGYGARVEVALTDGRVYQRWLQSSTTYGASAPELYLGLGDDIAAERVTIHWLDGETTELGAAEAGDLYTVAPD